LEKKRHYTIPIFIPMEACPFQCVFCDQKKISGKSRVSPAEDITSILHLHLSTIPENNTEVEVGFFGGTFTGLSSEKQIAYLESVLPFVENGKVSGIRLSTRPDFISTDILALLKKYPVTMIELGAQSMDDEVLKKSGRGHSSMDTEKASKMIIDTGFSLGLQMMIGLPGDSAEKSIETAKKIVELGAIETRIYPVIVIKGTSLEDLFVRGLYLPMDLETAIRVTKNLITIFDDSGVKIIRIGLHPSKGLLDKTDYIAGPFHPSFQELVMTSVWTDRFRGLLNEKSGDFIQLRLNPSDLHPAIGYYGTNRKLLENHFRFVNFVTDPEIKEKTFYADYH